MKRIQRIERLYNEFRDNAPNIASYFQIKDAEYTLVFTSPDKFHFTIIHENLTPYVFPTLPMEMSIHIAKFLYSKKEIVYHIDYPQDYPFKPPKWTLQTIMAQPYYKRATHILNHQYDLYWSPAISVEKDILNMIGTISCIEKDIP